MHEDDYDSRLAFDSNLSGFSLRLGSDTTISRVCFSESVALLLLSDEEDLSYEITFESIVVFTKPNVEAKIEGEATDKTVREMAIGLLNAPVISVDIDSSANLRLTFDNLKVEVSSSEDAEAWQISAQDLSVVATPSRTVVVWGRGTGQPYEVDL